MSEPAQRPRPTHTVIVPANKLRDVLYWLIAARCTFTCEVSPDDDERGPWYVGVFADGVAVVERTFGPSYDAGTLGDHL